ncbi:nucleoside diphosphate kinase regulator [Phenylobacterium sp.]|uniref:nucleoside diphosphate kinase regulator n=1 Tax=Phenylobacterium sp. TaxID=1871053 RepID=UPI002FDB8A2F
MTAPKALERPPIILSETDAERIGALALRAEARLPDLAELLMQEIDRAEVRPDHATPPDVAGMGSRVTFLDQGTRRTVELAYPSEADIEAGRISILTPVGAGLLGLRPGQQIDWPDREGRSRPLQVVAVEPPPC